MPAAAGREPAKFRACLRRGGKCNILNRFDPTSFNYQRK
jgi:hypothetical protein